MDDPRFLNSDTPEPEVPQQFAALGHPGSEHYIGLETFENPGCMVVTMSSDEVMSVCPITKQPDFYRCVITLEATERLIESKSLKLFFQNIMRSAFKEEIGVFCESLAVFIRDHICEQLECSEEQVQVILEQKSRGGISIKAMA